MRKQVVLTSLFFNHKLSCLRKWNMVAHHTTEELRRESDSVGVIFIDPTSLSFLPVALLVLSFCTVGYLKIVGEKTLWALLFEMSAGMKHEDLAHTNSYSSVWYHIIGFHFLSWSIHFEHHLLMRRSVPLIRDTLSYLLSEVLVLFILLQLLTLYLQICNHEQIFHVMFIGCF